MKENRKIVFNHIVFLFVSLLLAGLQSSFFSHILGSLPSPLLWLCVISYWGIYRPQFHGLIFAFLVSLILLGFSTYSLSFLFLFHFVVVQSARFFRSRFFWPGSSYFMLVNGIHVVFYHICFFVFSHMFEMKPMDSLNWLSYFVQLLWAPVISFILYFLFRWLDAVTYKFSVTNLEEEAI